MVYERRFQAPWETCNGVVNIPGFWVHRTDEAGSGDLHSKRTIGWAGRKMELSPLTLLIIFSLSMLVIPVGGFFVSKAFLFEGEESKVWELGYGGDPEFGNLNCKLSVQFLNLNSTLTALEHKNAGWWKAWAWQSDIVWTPDPSDHTEPAVFSVSLSFNTGNTRKYSWLSKLGKCEVIYTSGP